MEDKVTMPNKPIIATIAGWIFGLIVLTIGVLNLILVHPVPGIAYLLVSLLYFPPVTAYFRRKLGFGIPAIVKILLGIVLMMFTLGVSDLGDMIDKL